MFIDLEESAGELFTFRMSHVDQNTGEIVWDDEVKGVQVKIRSWKPFFEERAMSRERIIEWKINPKTRQNERHSNLKDLTPEELKKERDDAIDYAITGLTGWNDKKTRKEIPCTRENKIALMKKDFFDRFFTECQQKIDVASVEVKEVAEKN